MTHIDLFIDYNEKIFMHSTGGSVDEEITYARNGRMDYHPEFHPNHGKPFSESDLEYLCKYYEADGGQLMAMALGRTVKTILSKVTDLRRKGLFEHYKNLNKHW